MNRISQGCSLVLLLILAYGDAGVSSAYAQELNDLIEVTAGQSVQATGFRPTDRDAYLALEVVPRTRGVPPPKADLSDKFPTPANQGRQANCVAWAVGYAARSYYLAVDSGGDRLRLENVVSPAFLYNTLNVQQKGGSDCQTPIAISDALDLLKVRGAVPLTAMKYHENDCLTQVNPAVLSAHAKRFRLKEYRTVDDEIDIKKQVAGGNPVIFAIHLTKDFDSPAVWNAEAFSKNGPFKSTAKDGRAHAMVITGYDDARKAYKFMNSWGNAWGEGGFGWIDYQAAKALWIEGYVMTVEAVDTAPPARPAPQPPQQTAVVTLPRMEPKPVVPSDSLESRKSGSSFRDCDNCPELVVIPAGQFNMGSGFRETNRSGAEGPTHRVSFSRPFAVGKFEVTFDEWDACVRAGGCAHNPSDDGWGRGRQPVIHVSWHDAKQYTQWLSTRTGRPYRLLSESEWEYVARAGIGAPYHTGETINPTQANYNSAFVYAGGVTGVPQNRTVPVGQYPANAIGVHDMYGNVYEWTEDCRNDNYQGAPDDGSAWSSGDCTQRTKRGGSWINLPRDLRSAARSKLVAEMRYNFVGFRVAR